MNDRLPSKNRYLYNGKEVQREVFGGYPLGWYDYGARGLNSDFCRFMSVDPMAQMYYPISPYVYCLNNPIKFVDPDGRWVESAWDVFSLVSGVHNLVGNVRLGNVKGAVADGLGIVIDAFAVVAPGIPGGVGAVRAADKVVDAGKAVPKSNRVIEIGPIGDPGGQVMKQLPEAMQNNAKTTNKGRGTVFKDPKNPQGNNVRVENSNTKSPNLGQKRSYVKETKDGKVVDVKGKEVNSKSIDSHIEKEKYKYKR